MAFLYRVLPFLADASSEEPGGAFYIPGQGGGRLDNSEIYSVLYLSDASAGAIAEAFGRFPEWSSALLQGSPSLPGSARAIAKYRLADDEPVCDLDDPEQLLALRLRPSEVVSRDYSHTRRWARQIYESRKWIGLRWWSYYDPRWVSAGLWDIGRLKLEEVRPLRLDDAALVEASRTIVRRIIESSRT